MKIDVASLYASQVSKSPARGRNNTIEEILFPFGIVTIRENGDRHRENVGLQLEGRFKVGWEMVSRSSLNHSHFGH